jgi:flagellar hook protein FlgE
MGIFGAMLTSVSGLRAQSYALENISGNIANSQTSGFKRVDSSFVDLIPDMPFKKELAGSVSAYARLTNTVQGDLQTTGVPTHMALNGEGFFIVQERVGFANNKPIFNSTDLYTRRGDFSLDKDGYLVNGAGFFLKGSSINPVTGEIAGNANGVVRISSEPIPAKRTTEIVYRANLPSKPATSNSATGTAGSELFAAPPTTLPPTYEPRVLTGTAAPPPGVRGDDANRFISQSISGGSISMYNDVGAPIDVQVRWAKVANTSGSETWNLYYMEDQAATGATVAWRNLGSAVTFGTNGQMNSATGTLTIPSTALINGASVGGAVTINFGADGLTQYSSSSGLMQASTITQDGYPSGTLDAVSVTSDGRISGNYSNGRVVPVASIAVGQFNADNALKRRDGGAYEQTLESGLPIISLSGTTVIGGAVEGSNTDIAEEFSKMIVTQQAYSANTRVVTTAQQMLSDVINIIR